MAIDQYEYSTTASMLVKASLMPVRAPTKRDLTSAFGLTRSLLRTGALVLPDSKALRDQLESIRQSEAGPVTPRTADGHADLVSALVAAVWHDRRYGPLDGGTAGAAGAVPSGWRH